MFGMKKNEELGNTTAKIEESNTENIISFELGHIEKDGKAIVAGYELQFLNVSPRVLTKNMLKIIKLIGKPIMELSTKTENMTDTDYIAKLVPVLMEVVDEDVLDALLISTLDKTLVTNVGMLGKCIDTCSIDVFDLMLIFAHALKFYYSSFFTKGLKMLGKTQ